MNLKFAKSFEDMKSSEKKLKANKAKEKRQKAYAAARKKVGLGPKEHFCKCHVKKLTVEQMKAVSYIECRGLIINGKAAVLREKLLGVLPDELGIPQYETQDYFDDDVPPSDDDVTIELEIELDQMSEGDLVEVYWRGDNKWYPGEVSGIDLDDKTFQIDYLDGKKLWHSTEFYKCRFAC